MGRCPEIVGGPPRSLPRSGREAPGCRSRGPPGRVRRLRGRHPRRQLRRRRGHRLGPGPLDPLSRPRRGDAEGKAPLRAPRLQAPRQVDAGAPEDEGEDHRQGVAAHQGARRLGPQRVRRGLPAGVGLLGFDARGDRVGSEPGGRDPERARKARGAARTRPRRRRRLDAGGGARRRVHPGRLAVGAQIRRIPAACGARGRSRPPALPARNGFDRHVSRRRACRGLAPLRRVRHRRRSRRARRVGPAALQPPPETRAPPAPAGYRARGRGAAGDALCLRPSGVRGLRPARASVVQTQRASRALSAAYRARALRRPRRGEGRRSPRGRRRDGPRRRRGQEVGFDVSIRPLLRVGEGEAGPHRRLRRGGIHRSRRRAHRLRRSAPRLLERRRPRLRGKGGYGLLVEADRRDVRAPAESGSEDARVLRRGSDRQRPRLGRARDRLRGALQGADRRGTPAPPRIPSLPRRQDGPGMRRRAFTGRCGRAAGAASGFRRDSSGEDGPFFQSRQSLLARGGLHERRPDRVLPRDLAVASAVSERSAGRDDAVSRRDHRKVVLPEGRALVRAGLDTHRNESGASTPSGRSTTSSATTSRRCSTSPTSDRSRSTSGPAASPRPSGPTGASWIWTPRARRSPTS